MLKDLNKAVTKNVRRSLSGHGVSIIPNFGLEAGTSFAKRMLMGKKKTILQSEYPYHLTARCINKEWFAVPMDEVWKIMENYLFFLHYAFGFRIYNFVLMNNHFHLLASTPNANLSQGMNYFMRETSRLLSRRAGRINQTYGAPYHWCIVDTDNYFLNAYKYVYRNPVEAKLSKDCESYKYSSLNGLIGERRLNIPLVEDTILFKPLFSVPDLLWLNEANKEDSIEIQRALTKQYFRYDKNYQTKKPHRSEAFLY